MMARHERNPMSDDYRGAHRTPEGERSTSEKTTHRRHDDPTYEGRHAAPDTGDRPTDRD